VSVIYTVRFNIKNSALSHGDYLRVSYDSDKIQRLFTHTTLTGWSVFWRHILVTSELKFYTLSRTLLAFKRLKRFAPSAKVEWFMHNSSFVCPRFKYDQQTSYPEVYGCFFSRIL